MSKEIQTVYPFHVERIDHSLESMEVYRGKVLLIVNVASRCGFTPQYKSLESLYRTYRVQGLEILGFPCNQFGSQEPGSEQEIADFCSLKYDVTFPLFSKIDVNGPTADPLYVFLRKSLRGWFGFDRIQWNFTKFLIDRDGVPRRRFGPAHPPSFLSTAIQRML